MGAPVPFVQHVADTFAPQDPAEVPIVVEEWIFAADEQHDVHSAKGIETAGADQVGQELQRSVEVELLVAIPVEQVAEAVDVEGEVVAAGEGGQLMEQVRVTKGEVGGVKGPEAAALGDGAGMAVLNGHQEHHRAENVLLEGGVAAHLVRGRTPAAVEALPVDAVDAVDLQCPASILCASAATRRRSSYSWTRPERVGNTSILAPACPNTKSSMLARCHSCSVRNFYERQTCFASSEHILLF